MSTNQVRVSNELYESARAIAKPKTRSINQQIEYWAKLGKIGEANPQLSIFEIKNLLVSLEQAKQGQVSQYIFEEEDK